MNFKNYILAALIIAGACCTAEAQVGYGLTVSHELYQRFNNPIDEIASNSAGNIFLNFGLGPKLWLGGDGFSLSAEGQCIWGMTTFATDDYKGLGSLSFPLLAKLNFGGGSGFNDEGKIGVSLGGGIEYFRTELYGVTQDFKDQGVVRDYNRVYMAQGSVGFGLNGFFMHLYVRYGWDPDDSEVNALHIGIQYDFNIPPLKKIQKPESAL